MSYAQNTEVATDRSKMQIEKTLTRFGANSFGYGWTEVEGSTAAIVTFQLRGRRIEMRLKLPPKGARRFTHSPTGKARSEAQAADLWDKECRRLWRALELLIRAKTVAVTDGISTFEHEFLSDTVVPTEDGRATTVSQWLETTIGLAYSSGKKLPLLTMAGGGA